ncbi:hypothetical protein MSIMFI_03352 [Mycobacterium simulans]|nr:hypothetical protein MSIMFI_03352 [Mycobacterium simulans]
MLGSVVYDRTLVGWADAMHRSMLLGIFGERLVELAACWALVLLATGMILWWPRGGWRAGGTFWPRLSGRGRRFWRDLHGPVGLWTGALIGFLVLTGLPWAGGTGPLLHRGSGAAGGGGGCGGGGTGPSGVGQARVVPGVGVGKGRGWAAGALGQVGHIGSVVGSFRNHAQTVEDEARRMWAAGGEVVGNQIVPKNLDARICQRRQQTGVDVRTGDKRQIAGLAR